MHILLLKFLMKFLFCQIDRQRGRQLLGERPQTYRDLCPSLSVFGSGSESCYGEAVFCLSTRTAFLFSLLYIRTLIFMKLNALKIYKRFCSVIIIFWYAGYFELSKARRS